jgi:broad specificity phosphatase PhoE
MRIILFRHGQKQKSDSNLTHERRVVSLTPKGVEQIEQLAEKLKNDFPELVESKIIYSSPLPRTVQSAEIVRSTLKIKEIISAQELEEYYAYNDYALDINERESLMERSMINPNWKPKGVVSLNTKLDTFEDFVKSLDNDSLILISTHGALIRNLVYRLAPEHRPPDNEILNAKIKEGGYTLLELKDDELKVIKFNV